MRQRLDPALVEKAGRDRKLLTTGQYEAPRAKQAMFAGAVTRPPTHSNGFCFSPR